MTARRRERPQAQRAPLSDRLASLDKLLEHRLRLAIGVLLSQHDHLSFSRLKRLTDQTDGNLGANLRRLEEAGYVDVKKEFVDRRPVSWYSLSAAGRVAVRRHIAALSAVIQGADAGPDA